MKEVYFRFRFRLITSKNVINTKNNSSYHQKDRYKLQEFNRNHYLEDTMSVGAILNSISGSSSQPVVQQPNPAPVETTPKQAPVQPGHDTVKLSGAALARSLKQQGQSVAQIALAMHLDANSVDSYLGVTAKAAAPAPQAPSPAEEAKEPATAKATEAIAGKG